MLKVDESGQKIGVYSSVSAFLSLRLFQIKGQKMEKMDFSQASKLSFHSC